MKKKSKVRWRRSMRNNAQLLERTQQERVGLYEMCTKASGGDDDTKDDFARFVRRHLLVLTASLIYLPTHRAMFTYLLSYDSLFIIEPSSRREPSSKRGLHVWKAWRARKSLLLKVTEKSITEEVKNEELSICFFLSRRSEPFSFFLSVCWFRN